MANLTMPFLFVSRWRIFLSCSYKTQKGICRRLGKTKLTLRQVCKDLSFPQSISYSKFAWFTASFPSVHTFFSHSATTNSYSTAANSLQDQIWQLTGPDQNMLLGSRNTSAERWYWCNYSSHCQPVLWGYNNQHGDTQAVDPGSRHACEVGHSYWCTKGHRTHRAGSWDGRKILHRRGELTEQESGYLSLWSSILYIFMTCIVHFCKSYLITPLIFLNLCSVGLFSWISSLYV